MGKLVVPSGIGNTGRTPTLTEYVTAYLNHMRAPLKEKTMFSRGGKTVIHQPGERILYGPKGQKIRVVDTQHGTQVEHGNEQGRGVEHQHAHVRPQVVTLRLGADLGGDPDAVIREREREQARRRAGRQIFIPRG